MTYTIFTQFDCSFLASGHLANILERVKELTLNGHVVNMVYCDDKFTNQCCSNLTANQAICKVCMFYKKNLFQSLPKNVNYIPLSAYKTALQNEYQLPTISNVEELKRATYKGVKIGYAAFSTYLTLSRNLNPLFDTSFTDYISKTMRICCQYTDVVEEIIKTTQPDVIGCFNSRILYARPIVDLAERMGIKHISYETSYNLKGEHVKVEFQTTPHNVEENTQIINNLWTSDFLPVEKKKEIATSFFYKRRNSIPSGDKLYVKDQVLGMLPPTWDNSKHNILILNSSEDEYASLGDEFENKSLFPSQLEGIKHLIATFRDHPNLHFYLRVHPNLKNITYQYHLKLYELFNEVNNFTIINPHSPISTYSLIDNCDKVIVFGSTTGPEAVFWQKPTILLSFCVYSLLDICYVPKDTTELHALIENTHLPAKPIDNALKYGYYRMNDEYDVYKYYKYQRKNIKVLGKPAMICTYHHFGWLRNMYAVFLQLLGKIFYEKHLWYPTTEDKR